MSSTTRPFRFGVQVRGDLLPQWRDYARRIEDLGFATLVVPDHVQQSLAPMPALVAAACATTTLRVSTVVLANDFRHPLLAAMEAATVDVLTGGRFEFGLGTGWKLPDYESLGLPFDRPGVRLGRLKEAVAICKQFMCGGPLAFEGEYYRVHELEPGPRPIQRPHPPLMIGGRQRRLLSFAAREADIVGISTQDRQDNGAPRTPFREKVEWVRAAAGPRFSSVELQAMVLDVDVTDDRCAALDRIALRRNVPVTELTQSPTALVGSLDAIAEQLCAWREECDVSYFVVQPYSVDALAPVVARLAGR